MQIQEKKLSDTKLQLTLAADQSTLDEVKHQVLQELQRSVKIQGFREGKAPLALVEKNVDPSRLQTEFLEQAVNRVYAEAITSHNLRPVEQPSINITKFVPFTTLELTAEVEAVGDIKIPDYKKVKLARKPVSVTAKDVDEVIDNLENRAADRVEVKRAAQNGDEVVLDFAGRDAKTSESINGADGKDYPLTLGSKAFIPGFEENLVGLKANDTKEFTIAFPKDYGVAALQSKQVTFKVTIKKVSEIKKPKLDDAFAAKVGPFKTVAELKADIKKQLTTERESQNERDYENELIEKLAEKTTAAIPTALIDEEVERGEQNERQNIVYRGQTWEEYLKSEGLTEEKYRQQARPAAENRVKAGLMLSEIAEKEQLTVTPEELNARMQLLKSQYPDQKMQAELAKPAARREIASRLLTEKTIAKLVGYASKS